MIKLVVDSAWHIITAEPAATKEIYLDWDFSEWVVFEWWKYIKFADATLEETEITKTLQKAKAMLKQFIVNITSDKKKKKATVLSRESWAEYDPERWDKLFDSEKEAQTYADDFNSKQ